MRIPPPPSFGETSRKLGRHGRCTLAWIDHLRGCRGSGEECCPEGKILQGDYKMSMARCRAWATHRHDCVICLRAGPPTVPPPPGLCEEGLGLHQEAYAGAQT
jgi:hypothetical protein